MEESVRIASATGVDLHLNIAGPGARSYAFVIDWHIRLLLAMAWFALMSLAVVGGFTIPDQQGDSFLSFAFMVMIPAAVIYFLYHPVLEIVMRGRTPGKRMAGVRIVSLEGQEPTLLAHLIRNVLRLLDSMPVGYGIGLMATVFTKNAVRIGDIAAGTVLIYDSDARADKLDAVPVSPEAIRHYGLAKAELAQDLLNRWRALEKEQRVELAQKLIPELDSNVTPAADENALQGQLQALLAVAEQP